MVENKTLSASEFFHDAGVFAYTGEELHHNIHRIGDFFFFFFWFAEDENVILKRLSDFLSSHF